MCNSLVGDVVLTSIFLLSLLSVISLMLPSMRLLQKEKKKVSVRPNLNHIRVLVHFTANVF